MSNKNDASLQTTKQMLDELDALMEKMLSLPVNDLSDAPPFPQGVVKPPTAFSPSLAATLTLLEAPPPPVGEYPTDVQSFLSPPELSSQHPAFNPPHRPLSEIMSGLVPQPEPLTDEVEPPSVLPRVEALLASIPEPEPALTTYWVYWPLLWINLGFDGSTMILGGAGSWLRGQVVRTMLGFTGIALLVMAVGWFLSDWFGWK